jgi:NADP-dependent 3-hydroxy acid dehydrogenase YdfG
MGALSGQIALITGAGSGIGKAIAQAMAGQGALVCLVGRTKSKLESTATSLPVGVPQALVMPIDISSDEQLEALSEDLPRRSEELDILVMCAGEIAHGPIASAPIDAFDRLYRTNVRANYRLVQMLLPMLRKRPGQIVFVNSSVGLSSPPNVGQFSATQHALKAITDTLRAEVNADGIRVLSVYPGRVATPRQESLYANDAKQYKPEFLLQPKDVASVVLNAVTLPRTAEVTDISIRPLMKSY